MWNSTDRLHAVQFKQVIYFNDTYEFNESFLNNVIGISDLLIKEYNPKQIHEWRQIRLAN